MLVWKWIVEGLLGSGKLPATLTPKCAILWHRAWVEVNDL